MRFHDPQNRWSWCQKTLVSTLFSLAVLTAPIAARAQTAVVSGYISSFDVVNSSGQDVHGLELRLEGATQNDLYYTGS